MNILITGGAGFIGSHLVKHCIQLNHSVVTVDKLTYAGNLENLGSALHHPNHTFHQVDVMDENAISKIIESSQPQWIFHLAAESHVDRSIDGASDFVQTNVVGTYTLAEQAFQYWQQLNSKAKENFRYLQISTDEVYGSLGSDGYFSETSPYQPNSPYSATKAAGDLLVQAYHKTYQFPTLIANCSNNYGPNQYPEKLIPLCILNALEEKPLPVYGRGDQIRDWLYVEDHVQALMLIMQHGKIGEAYCIGGNNEKKNIDTVKDICRILDTLRPRKNKESYEKLIQFVADRPGHDARYAVDSQKIQRSLHWKPQMSFSEGLKTTIQWYLNHTDWVHQILSNPTTRVRRGLEKVHQNG